MSWMYSREENEGFYIYCTKNLWLWWLLGLPPIFLWLVVIFFGREIPTELRAPVIVTLGGMLLVVLGAYAVGGFEVWLRTIIAGLKGKRITIRRIGLGCERQIEK